MLCTHWFSINAMAHPAAIQHTQDPTNMPVGQILRRTREHYQKSLQDVENALRIRAEQIEAIEEGHAEKLPARVYAIGFVRSYAEFLGLDGEKMVHLFKHQSADQALEPELHFPVVAADSKAPPLWIILGCLIVLGLVAGGVFGVQGEDKTTIEQAVPDVPATLKPETLQRTQAAATKPEPAPVVETPKPKGITLKIRENSWVEIRDAQNKKLISRVLNAGDTYFVPDRKSLTMSIGNASGVEVDVDGQTLQPLGPKGKVIRNIPLNGKALKTRFAKPVEIPAQ